MMTMTMMLSVNMTTMTKRKKMTMARICTIQSNKKISLEATLMTLMSKSTTAVMKAATQITTTQLIMKMTAIIKIIIATMTARAPRTDSSTSEYTRPRDRRESTQQLGTSTKTMSRLRRKMTLIAGVAEVVPEGMILTNDQATIQRSVSCAIGAP